jgi:hypothetical protein
MTPSIPIFPNVINALEDFRGGVKVAGDFAGSYCNRGHKGGSSGHIREPSGVMRVAEIGRRARPTGPPVRGGGAATRGQHHRSGDERTRNGKTMPKTGNFIPAGGQWGFRRRPADWAGSGRLVDVSAGPNTGGCCGRSSWINASAAAKRASPTFLGARGFGDWAALPASHFRSVKGIPF